MHFLHVSSTRVCYISKQSSTSLIVYVLVTHFPRLTITFRKSFNKITSLPLYQVIFYMLYGYQIRSAGHHVLKQVKQGYSYRTSVYFNTRRKRTLLLR